MRLFYILFVLCIVGCTEELDTELTKSSEKLVFEGVISNKPGPYYFRVSKTKDDISFTETGSGNDSDSLWVYYESGTVGIQNATIILSDGSIIDTLVPCPNYKIIEYIDTETHQKNTYKEYYDINNLKGYYHTAKIQGKIGNYYTLEIVWNNQKYYSSAEILPVPKIDSFRVEFVKGKPGKFDYYTPFIYFKDDSTHRNYYLFSREGDASYFGFPYTILSNENIKSRINGIDILNGYMLHSWQRFGISPNDPPIYIDINSIDIDCYLYYKALIEQLNQDGGLYSPTPATPVSNISNGGLGYFRASAIESIKVEFKTND